MLNKVIKFVLLCSVLIAPIQVANASTISTVSYLVTLHDGVSAQDFIKMERHFGVDILRQFTFATSGFLANLTSEEYVALKNDSRVDHIEQDAIIGLSVEQALQNDSGWRPTWGLDRINQVDGVLDDFYSYEYSGIGVDVYVFDTGINSDHIEFTGRIKSGYSAIDDTNGIEDCNGHGSHVSGIVGGTTYGVAKSVSIIPVRVLGCTAAGSTASVLNGISWMIANHQAGIPAVANMSFAGSKSIILNEAVRSAIEDGITVVVGAGNNNLDSCNYSPASEPLAITVAATTIINAKASYSNYGPCVDIFAPGSDVVSAYYGSPTILRSRSGTSMATPYVTGVVAQILEQHPTWTPQDVSEQLLIQATPNAISNTGDNTVNLLLFNNSPRIIVEEPTTTTTTTTTTTVVQTTSTTSTTTIAPAPTTTSSTTTSTTIFFPPVTTTTTIAPTTTSTIPSTTTTTVSPVTITTTSTTVVPLTTTTTTTLPPTTTTTFLPRTTTSMAPTTTISPVVQQEEQEENPVIEYPVPEKTSSTTTSTTIPSLPTITTTSTTTTTTPIVIQVLSVPVLCKKVGQIKNFYKINYVCIKSNKVTKWVRLKTKTTF